MQAGDITGFTELVDVGDNFDPTTGRFKIKDEVEKGMYSLHISALKNGSKGKPGRISVYKNQDLVQTIYETDGGDYLMMNIVVTLYLQIGDEVKLENIYDESIFVDGAHPFTFTGYKI